MFDKNYFLDQLRSGAKMDDMGQALADAMNAAQEAYDAEIEAAKTEKANAEKTYAKREFATDLINLICNYGKLVAPEAADILNQYDEADVELMVHELDRMFEVFKSVAALRTALEGITPLESTTPKIPKTDEEILTNFIASLM